jgi:hypothetical protein
LEPRSGGGVDRTKIGDSSLEMDGRSFFGAVEFYMQKVVDKAFEQDPQ